MWFYPASMEQLYELDQLNNSERILRFRGVLKNVIGVDDLFPPEDGVREPAKPPLGPEPKIGSIALKPIQDLMFV
jgi:hypothetical protein